MRRHFPFVLILAIGLAGCSGQLIRRSQKLVVVKDNPPIYPVNADGDPGESTGRLDKRRGDTIESTGEHSGPGFQWHYLVVTSAGEVFIDLDAAHKLDEHLYNTLGPKFRLPVADDPAAWGRATAYIAKKTKLPIVVSSATIVRTDPVPDSDTSSVSYLVTRVPVGSHVEYEITCTSNRKLFNATEQAKQLAFYMTTGRERN